MRVCFVVPLHTQTEKADSIPLGILCLISQLRKEHDCSIVDMNYLLSEESKPDLQQILPLTLEEICKRTPDVVGFSCLCNSFHITTRIAKQLRERLPAANIIFGGPHTVSIERDILNEFTFIDAVFSGEADESILTYINSLDTDPKQLALSGVHTRQREQANCLPSPPRIDHLPIPAYDMLSSSHYQQTNPARAELLLSIDAGRGCPFSCSFCATREIWSKPRQKKASRILVEMRYLHDLFNKNKFRLVHDSFFFKKSATVEFLDYFIRHNANFEWGCSIKPDLLDETLIDRFIDAGCKGIFFGIESASDVVQKKIGKSLNLKKVEKNVKYAVSKGLGLITSFIIGFPFETGSDLQQTLDFHKRMVDLGVFKSMVNFLSPLPASKLRQNGYEIYFDGSPPNVSDASWMLDEEGTNLIRKYPLIFSSFYKYRPLELTEDELTVAFHVANHYAITANEQTLS